ncbi:MAG TPA: folylpolyglutamate synthase/dihydrofolate synthase family protein, partial [Candidatus Bathyarchaeia archaeon]|nr:folylpolyglutamate synthase/dihydrofolate synthase family protein [Candidatus Bathyarchaeia archaeon]
ARILALRGGERAGMRPGLERIEAVLDAIDRPEREYVIAQVGGTNGKGSISSMLAAIVQASGRRVGLYTSPHLCHYRERIRVDGRPISEADFVDGVEALGTLIARLDLTVFEAGTALALDHFCRAGVEVAVLEVGLGGRLDATTVGTPRVEVLGPIDYDHQAELGDTLTLIAREKAAIIRSGVAFSARQDPEAETVLRRRAAEVAVPLWMEGRDLQVAPRGFTLEAQRVDLDGPGWRLTDVDCALLGLYQPSNALLAAAAARELGAGEPAIRAGLRWARWPGRFQILQRDPVVVLDGAHNPAGARALAASLRAYFPGEPVTFVLGILADKDARGILSALAPLAARVVLTASTNPRAASPEALRALLPGAGSPVARQQVPSLPGLPVPSLSVEIAPSPRAALARAIAATARGIVCVAGSLSLIGDILAGAGDGHDLLAWKGA